MALVGPGFSCKIRLIYSMLASPTTFYPPIEKNVLLLQGAYQRATTKPFGHLLIDFDPKITDVLHFCLNVVAPQRTTFYIPSSTAKETLLIIEREKIAYTEALARK